MVSSALVDDLLEAFERRDWDGLRPLLHPYLHWTDGSGETVRGRRRVLEHLRVTDAVAPPAACELRDGQVYRWTEPLG